jgi:hypothetical protein
MAFMVASILEKDLMTEWKKHRADIQAIFKEVEGWADGMNVTAEFNVGVVKLTIEAQFKRPGSPPS